MQKKVLNSVKTTGLGFAPILKCFFDKCSIQQIIDENVPLDPRRKILSHGQASQAMITGILFQVMQLYKVCQFANETTVLDVILPGIAPEEYFDDRLADTLDAIFKFGIGNLEMLITRNMISAFDIKIDICHNDTTSVSTFGDCDNNKTEGSIKITFGYSKKHRQDLKQFVWSISVSSDSGFPLFQKAYSGNTADVTTYVEQWHNLIDLLGKRDFLYVADSKLITSDNMAHIHDNEGFFIAPAPMYESYKNKFLKAIDQHDHEVLLPYKEKMNRGFDTPFTVLHEDTGKEYDFRMIVLYDHGLAARKSLTLENRVEKTESAFAELNSKLNTYNLKTEEAIDKACRSILKKNQTNDFFKYEITNEPITTYKNKNRGRQPKNKEPEKIAVTQDNFKIFLTFDEDVFAEALSYCGYYPLLTNMPDEKLSIEDAMMAHKNQYKSEHLNRRAKSGYHIEPVYLHTPERIEALLFLFKIALQMVILMERSARQNIDQRDKGLDNFMPNRKDVRNPRAENLLASFQYMVYGETILPDGNCYGFVSDLTDLQKDILNVLGVPPEYYTYEYLFEVT